MAGGNVARPTMLERAFLIYSIMHFVESFKLSFFSSTT
jgi:hypothetical protein